eukprot:TRINITY_DN2864_c0_g3_i5.p1 TRINITY_DN2864_c0_g3~~TRINITY_DN2864_c0_g3_i5.p1  ORF type:complete len:245 (+),score=44.79 TRINITY_DN2864_c0_g3_i5:840-1574(+)
MQQNRIDPDTGDHLFEPKVNARASPEGVRGENIGEHLYQEYYEMEQRREELRRAEAQKIEDERERVKMNPNSAKILEKRSVSPAVPRPQEIRPEPKFRPKINEKSNELDPYKAKNVDRALLLYQKGQESRKKLEEKRKERDQEETQGCTFAPCVRESHPDLLSTYYSREPVWARSQKWKNLSEARMEEARQRFKELELQKEKCTFKPKLESNYKWKRPASTGNSTARGSADGYSRPYTAGASNA